MVDFGGWDMPVHYGSQIDEHHAVRRGAGMFDVSHMLAVDIEPREPAASQSGGRDFLRGALANNVDKLTAPGKALYSCLLRPDGGVLDDLIVYFLREDWFRLVVNAGTADKDLAWLGALIAERGPHLKLTPRRDLAMIAVQGPHARDTLRLEAGMNLYGQDMDEAVNPLESGLAWTVDLTSPRDFVGKAALLAAHPSRQLAGLVLQDQGGILRGHQQVTTAHGDGEVTSGSYSPTLSRSIALARLPARVTPGDVVHVDVRGKPLAARVVKPPFVRNGKSLID
jgi:glycine cleavage system aminomethyltransferase T